MWGGETDVKLKTCIFIRMHLSIGQLYYLEAENKNILHFTLLNSKAAQLCLVGFIQWVLIELACRLADSPSAIRLQLYLGM